MQHNQIEPFIKPSFSLLHDMAHSSSTSSLSSTARNKLMPEQWSHKNRGNSQNTLLASLHRKGCPSPGEYEQGQILTDGQMEILRRMQAVIRGNLDRAKYKAIRKMKSRRDKIVEEILSSERIYVANLNILNNVFLIPLLKSGLAEKEENLRQIFSSIPVIIGVNTCLLKELEERIQSSTSSTTLSDIFLRMADYLKSYTQYINSYGPAILTFVQLSEKKHYIDWEKKLDKSECKGLTLKDYLILPIQRLPRYRMLLEDLVKNTWTTHHDYEKLRQASTKISQIAGFVNSSKGNSETISKVFEIAESILNLPDDFMEPWRRFVKSGPVIFDGKPTQLLLFNDILLFARPKNNNKLQLFLQIDLTNLAVEDPTEDEELGLVLVEGAEKQEVKMKSKEEKHEWVEALASAKKMREELKLQSCGTTLVLDRAGVSTLTEARRKTHRRSNSARMSVLLHGPLSILTPSKSPTGSKDDTERPSQGIKPARSHIFDSRFRASTLFATQSAGEWSKSNDSLVTTTCPLPQPLLAQTKPCHYSLPPKASGKVASINLSKVSSFSPCTSSPPSELIAFPNFSPEVKSSQSPPESSTGLRGRVNSLIGSILSPKNFRGLTPRKTDPNSQSE